MSHIVYTITNTANGKMYIGKTSRPVKERWYRHRYNLRENKHPNDYLQNAWNKYGEESFLFEILEEYPSVEEVNNAERFYVLYFKWLGLTLYNHRAGGEGGWLSQAAIEKMRQANIGKKHSNETKLKMSLSQKGKKHSLDACERISKGKTGVPFSCRDEESRRTKISETMKARTMSEQHLESIRAASKKRKYTVSEATRAKISAVQKGVPKKPRTPEHCKNISLSKKRAAYIKKYGVPPDDTLFD